MFSALFRDVDRRIGNNKAGASTDWAAFSLSLIPTISLLLLVYLTSTTRHDGKRRKAALQEIERRIGRRLPGCVLSDMEIMVAQDLVDTANLSTSFSSIGGVSKVIDEIKYSVVLPLTRPELFRGSSLRSPPKGVLFYGAPGTGKTMLARAIAKESGAAFINVRLSTIMNKWFGESQKLVAGLFSLAHKLSPSIIFIDEVDALLGHRSSASSTNEASLGIKTEFLTLWDGLLTDTQKTSVMVLGATNRPGDLDSAILRRLPRSFEVGLPDWNARLEILQLILKNEELDRGVNLAHIAQITAGWSGSDLQDLCQSAAMKAVRSFCESVEISAAGETFSGMRALSMADFEDAFCSVGRTSSHAAAYTASHEPRPTVNGAQQAEAMRAGLMSLLGLVMQSNMHAVPRSENQPEVPAAP